MTIWYVIDLIILVLCAVFYGKLRKAHKRYIGLLKELEVVGETWEDAKHVSDLALVAFRIKKTPEAKENFYLGLEKYHKNINKVIQMDEKREQYGR